MFKQLTISLLLLALIFSSCELKPEKVRRRIALHKVMVIEDTAADNRSEKKTPPFVDTSYIEYVFKAYDLVAIKNVDSTIQVQLQYADTTNFLKKNFYDGLRKAYFNCETAIKVCAAQYYLKQINPQLSLVIYDASRPQHIQQMMWDSLDLPSWSKFNYLAPPDETSMHNYGCAVDCGIINIKTGESLDMGTAYDTFDKLSQPVYEYRFLKSGQLSREAYHNRRLLRHVMRRAKMNSISTEWWHFSSYTKAEAMAKFPLIK